MDQQANLQSRILCPLIPYCFVCAWVLALRGKYYTKKYANESHVQPTIKYFSLQRLVSDTASCFKYLRKLDAQALQFLMDQWRQYPNGISIFLHETRMAAHHKGHPLGIYLNYMIEQLQFVQANRNELGIQDPNHLRLIRLQQLTSLEQAPKVCIFELLHLFALTTQRAVICHQSSRYLFSPWMALVAGGGFF